MVRDGFYEESAGSQRSVSETRWYTAFKVIAIIFFVIGISLGFMFSGQIIGAVLGNKEATTVQKIFAVVEWVLLLVLIIGSGFIFWFGKNRFNISYDYTFVEDEVRITKVFNGKKRKYLYTLKADRILQIGWVESDAFENATRALDKKKVKWCTPNREASEGKELIYVLQTTSAEKAVYILECRRPLLENLVFVAGRNKLEKK